MAKKYTCPECDNNDGSKMRAFQKCWIYLSVGEHGDGTHTLEDGELTDNYFGNVEIHCLVCGVESLHKPIILEED